MRPSEQCHGESVIYTHLKLYHGIELNNIIPVISSALRVILVH